MAAYLLDTHVIIWLLEADPNLPDSLVQIIENGQNRLFVSVATLWEMTIKSSLSKLELQKSLEEIFEHLKKLDIEFLSIRENHLVTLRDLPFHHRDPFDRLIISQSKAETITLMSKDSIFKNYDVDLIWHN
jgi:PIN domain nuclease of toxin-antitoxin system